MADFDIIIVGSGCAGSVAAQCASKAGKSVLVVERGNFAGTKNMTGGRLYTHVLADLYPDYGTDAPLERRVAREKLSFLDSAAATTLDFCSAGLAEPGCESYTVLRAPFDQWLAEKAEAAGAEYIYGIPVEHLIKDGERVAGIAADGDEISAELVILADGANSLLSAEAVGALRPVPHQMAVGIKQVIALDAATIEDRFLLNSGEGAAWLFVGDCTKGHVGGGFVYTNRDSLSLGLVATLSGLATSTTSICQMLENFKRRADLAPLLKGGEVVEHSGHLVPEGGYQMVPELAGEGVLITGDAAMLCMNLGYMVRGMDLAIASGAAAAQTACSAIDAGDTSKAGLTSYRQALEDGFVLRDLKAFSRFPAYMEQTSRLYDGYPHLMAEMLESLFIVDGSPILPLKRRLLRAARQVGLGKVLKDVRGALRAL
jgi:electron transfer flavoprotein-quinone oxidoreductase